MRIAPALPRALPFYVYMAFLVIGPATADRLPDSRWLYAAQVSAVAATLLLFRRHYAELSRSFQPRLTFNFLALTIGLGIAVFLAWINLDFPVLALDHGAGFNPTNDNGGVDWSLVALRISGAVLVVPVMEELFWRSLVMRWMERSDFMSVSPAMVGVRSAALSSLVFGLEHSLWFAGLLAGLAYAWLYMRSGNLWTAIIAHGVTNLLLGIWVVTTANWRFW